MSAGFGLWACKLKLISYLNILLNNQSPNYWKNKYGNGSHCKIAHTHNPINNILQYNLIWSDSSFLLLLLLLHQPTLFVIPVDDIAPISKCLTDMIAWTILSITNLLLILVVFLSFGSLHYYEAW